METDETSKQTSSHGHTARPRLDMSKFKICAAPKFKDDEVKQLTLVPADKQLNLSEVKELNYNPQYSELQLAEQQEQEALRAKGKLIKKNTLTGFYEATNLNETQFELERRNRIKELKSKQSSTDLAAPQDNANEVQSIVTKPEPRVVGKRLKNDDPTDLDGYLGPWAAYEGERHSAMPSEEDSAILAEYIAKKKRRTVIADDDKTGNSQPTEKAQLHIKDPYDYQGRSFLQAPRDLDGVNLHQDSMSENCRIPRNLSHTYRGHNKAVTAIRLFPKTAHLLLSASLDNKVKLWEVYKEKRCVMTYAGHTHGVRDIDFNRDGSQFVSASYDKYIKLWDVETGQCMQRFTNNKLICCVKFNPDPSNSHLFLAGMSNKKILCWDCRSGEIVQEYDRHLDAVNSITFVDENRKFISTSDDKSIRVWEWDIPVDVKYIADPTLHSMPAVTSAPNNKRLLCQSMDNKIQAFTCHSNKFKLDNKKVFKGHMVAGYACVPEFSCDMSLVISGDADGKIFFWSWSSGKIITTLKAHDNACISVLWHPHERQKLISAGWDNLIKIWN